MIADYTVHKQTLIYVIKFLMNKYKRKNIWSMFSQHIVYSNDKVWGKLYK